MIRRVAFALERWMDDESSLLSLLKGFIVFGGAMAGMVMFIANRFEDSALEQCLARGGAWTVVGSHVERGMIQSGKVFVPTQRVVRDEGCIEVPRAR